MTLALQTKADWLLLDQREARKVAKSLGLHVTGVLGVLLRARREGKLPSLRDAMEQVEIRAGFRMGADLVAELLRKAGEQGVESRRPEARDQRRKSGRCGLMADGWGCLCSVFCSFCCSREWRGRLMVDG
ncbi:MAG TPA: DUF3368 domain-containing protein [Planctomycetaceae bacterium]|nr:DUF3368 domain-containing protein [Planctomycetaceae bacterium]